MLKLKFQKGNAKLNESIYIFSLPAGWSCPRAKDCLSKAMLDKATGKRSIQDGAHTKFRCFAASAEVQYTNTYLARQHNFDILRQCKTVYEMADIITHSLPRKATKVRIHVSGDFYNQTYFDAWCQVAHNNPHILFYAYTKSLDLWVNKLGTIPANLVLTASEGGTLDHLIAQHGLRYAKVVYSEAQAASLGLEIDHDDSHAYQNGPSFALLIHGVQPKGSEASEALKALKGSSGYNKKARKAKEALQIVGQ